tara:strand:+ start:610 stop:753 length:144 start_codon:yes stop_codon:yes gene_type:complete
MTIEEIIFYLKKLTIADIFNFILCCMFILAVIGCFIAFHTSIGQGNV